MGKDSEEIGWLGGRKKRSESFARMKNCGSRAEWSFSSLPSRDLRKFGHFSRWWFEGLVGTPWRQLCFISRGLRRETGVLG